MTVARPPLLAQGVVAAAVAGLLLGLAAAGAIPLLVAVAVLQLLLALGFLALVEAPASSGTFALAAAAAGAADVITQVDDGRVAGLAGVVALALVAALLQQLARRDRSRVTEVLADSLVVVLLMCSAACLAAAALVDGGDRPLRVALAAAGTAALAGRVGDAVVHRPSLAYGATRAWPGLLLALGGGCAVAVAVAGSLTTSEALLVGLVAAATVAAADLLVDLAAAELTPAHEDARRVAALRPVSVLLPYAVLGPVVLLAVRLLDR